MLETRDGTAAGEWAVAKRNSDAKTSTSIARAVWSIAQSKQLRRDKATIHLGRTAAPRDAEAIGEIARSSQL
jgi:hypothetical protein